MRRICNHCNTLVEGDGAFCPQCGAALESAVDLSKPQNATPPVSDGEIYINNPQPQNSNAAPMPDYPRSANVNTNGGDTQPMTTGQWIGVILAGLPLCLVFFPIGPLISLILHCVWAFGNTPEPKKSYSRAALICMVVVFVIGVIIVGAMIACVVSAAESFGNNWESYWNEIMGELESGGYVTVSTVTTSM